MIRNAFPPASIHVPLDGSELAERALPDATASAPALPPPIVVMIATRTPEVWNNVPSPMQMPDGEGGFLVSREEDWVPRIDGLLSDRAEAQRIGGLGRERVRQHFLITRLLEDELGLMAGVRSKPAPIPS